MSPPRTSLSHPILVGWLPRIDLPGKVGLTIAPGKRAWSHKGRFQWERDLAADLTHLASHDRARVLVSLIEDHELASLHIPDLFTAARDHGLSVLRLPIVDGGVPTDVAAVASLVDEIIRAASSGDNVVIHCAGGLGRSGTIGGCVLVPLGATPEQALDATHAARGPDCPENPRQERFIAAFAARRP